MRSSELKRGEAASDPRIGESARSDQESRPKASMAHSIKCDDNTYFAPLAESSPPAVRTPDISGRDVRWGLCDLLLFLISAVLFGMFIVALVMTCFR